jgi:hypothetical protein
MPLFNESLFFKQVLLKSIKSEAGILGMRVVQLQTRLFLGIVGKDMFPALHHVFKLV